MIYVKLVFIMILSMLAVGALIMVTLTGCTMSFQNISTHGTATDLVDENQSASPKIAPKIKMPGVM